MANGSINKITNFVKNMNAYTIKISNILQREVTVNADNVFDAIKEVRQQYNDCKIVLDWEDLVDTDIAVVDKNPTEKKKKKIGFKK